MQRHWKIFLLLFAIIGLCSCNHDDPEPVPTKKKKTVIVYMVAENSLSSFLDSDIREMVSAKDSIPLDCNLVLYVDAPQMPVCYTIDRQTGKSEWKTYPEQDSCDSLVFRNTLADIINEFPAEQYGLIMWSHGSGWIPSPAHQYAQKAQQRRTIGIDNNSNNSTNTGTELEIPAMRHMLDDLGVRWDYIFFDACFMQCVEVDYELRGVCDQIVASPAEIPGEGAPYHLIMSSMFKDNAAEEIAQIYYQSNINKSYSGGTMGGLIISVSKSNEMEHLAETMKPYIISLFSDTREYDMKGIQVYCKYTLTSSWKPEYYDLGSAMNQLLSSPADYEVIKAQLDRSYPVNLHTKFWLSQFFTYQQGVISDEEHLASVSIFLPHSKYDSMHYPEALQDYEWYHAAGWDQTGW